MRNHSVKSWSFLSVALFASILVGCDTEPLEYEDDDTYALFDRPAMAPTPEELSRALRTIAANYPMGDVPWAYSIVLDFLGVVVDPDQISSAKFTVQEIGAMLENVGVELADWFEVLNKDFRYQLTCIGGFATVYVAEEISGNRFKIAGGNPGMKVSWQVTGIRQDRYANAHRIPVEEEKPPEDQSYYLHPDLYGKPEEKSVDWKYDQEILGEMQKAESGLRR